MAEPGSSRHGLLDTSPQTSLHAPDVVRWRVAQAGDALAKKVSGGYLEASGTKFGGDDETGVRCELIEGAGTPGPALLAAAGNPEPRPFKTTYRLVDRGFGNPGLAVI